jgi:xanthine dehydrogenase YagT iron-sulfur-binding subunit
MARSSENMKPARPPGSGMSRRGFLKGAGVTAVSTALLDTGFAHAAEAQARAAEPKVLGPGAVPVTLNVNGVNQQVKIEPRTTLAEALRIHLDMTGTKVVCDRGACSACTVWLDDVPVNSCMTLAVDVGDRKITTIEGLAPSLDQLHPVQEAFIEHDGLQCGFCTPGMVMSCAALLKRNPHPTQKDVRDAVSGNLCRCGTYPHVFKATLAAADKMAGVNPAAGKGASNG